MIYQQIINYSIKNNVFSIFMRCQNVNECVSWFWKFGSLALEMCWKKLGNMYRVVFTNPVTFTSSSEIPRRHGTMPFLQFFTKLFCSMKVPSTNMSLCLLLCLLIRPLLFCFNKCVCLCMHVCLYLCLCISLSVFVSISFIYSECMYFKFEITISKTLVYHQIASLLTV